MTVWQAPSCWFAGQCSSRNKRNPEHALQDRERAAEAAYFNREEEKLLRVRAELLEICEASFVFCNF
jgi:hypothetical protein